MVARPGAVVHRDPPAVYAGIMGLAAQWRRLQTQQRVRVSWNACWCLES